MKYLRKKVVESSLLARNLLSIIPYTTLYIVLRRWILDLHQQHNNTTVVFSLRITP